MLNHSYFILLKLSVFNILFSFQDVHTYAYFCSLKRLV